MGLPGVYMMIDESTLDSLSKLAEEELFEKINELEETNEIYTIDKLWDALHFLLTGVSASSPVKNNKLSEAILGVHLFDTDDDLYIAYTEKDELPEIYNALKSVNMNDLANKFEPKILKKKKIYPNIWENNKKDELFKELTEEYNALLDFYKKALEKNVPVTFSVL